MWARYAKFRAMLNNLVGLEEVKAEAVRHIHDAMGRQTLSDATHHRHILLSGGFGTGKKTAAHILAMLSVVVGEIAAPEFEPDAKCDKVCVTCGEEMKAGILSAAIPQHCVHLDDAFLCCHSGLGEPHKVQRRLQIQASQLPTSIQLIAASCTFDIFSLCFHCWYLLSGPMLSMSLPLLSLAPLQHIISLDRRAQTCHLTMLGASSSFECRPLLDESPLIITDFKNIGSTSTGNAIPAVKPAKGEWNRKGIEPNYVYLVQLHGVKDPSLEVGLCCLRNV